VRKVGISFARRLVKSVRSLPTWGITLMPSSIRPKEIGTLNSDREFALVHLLDAHNAAHKLGKSPLSFSCQLLCLHAIGVTETSLRWLVHHGFAEHHKETTTPRQIQRSFLRSPNLCFDSSTCFVLSPLGVSAATQLPTRSPSYTNHRSRKAIPKSPRYDADRRTLHF